MKLLRRSAAIGFFAVLPVVCFLALALHHLSKGVAGALVGVSVVCIGLTLYAESKGQA